MRNFKFTAFKGILARGNGGVPLCLPSLLSWCTVGWAFQLLPLFIISFVFGSTCNVHLGCLFSLPEPTGSPAAQTLLACWQNKQNNGSLIFSHHDRWQDYKSVSHTSRYCTIMSIKGYFSLLSNIRTTVKLVDIKNIRLKHPYFYG